MDESSDIVGCVYSNLVCLTLLLEEDLFLPEELLMACFLELFEALDQTEPLRRCCLSFIDIVCVVPDFRWSTLTLCVW